MRRMCFMVVLALFLFSCGSNDAGPETYATEIINGIKHVHNLSPEWGDEPKVELQFVREFGQADGTDDNYTFFNPTDAGIDADGNVYVLDYGNKRIQKYDNNGTYIATIGREGEGPGELMRPIKMCFDPEGRIFVADTQLRRVQIFSLDGKDLGSFRPERQVSSIGFLSKGQYATNASFILDPENEEKPGYLLSIYDDTGRVLKEMGEILTQEDSRMNSFANQVMLDIDNNGNIYSAFKYQNRIGKYSPDGTCLVRIDRPLNYEINNTIENQTYNIGGRDMEIGIPQLTFVSGSLGVDHKNRLWVATYHAQPLKEEVKVTLQVEGEAPKDIKQGEDDDSKKETEPEEPVKLEIYDDQGILLGYQSITGFTGIFRICGSRIFFFGNEEMTVKEYMIVDK